MDIQLVLAHGEANGGASVFVVFAVLAVLALVVALWGIGALVDAARKRRS